MSENQPVYEPAYSSKISPLKQFTILFCAVLGVIGLIMFVPLLLLFGYMVVEGGHVAMYFIGLTALPFLIGVGTWASKVIYREMKKRIIDNRYPSGYDLGKNKLSFQVFDTDKNEYIYGEVPYSEMEKCVISVHADPILRQVRKGKYEIEGYYYSPVAHIVYEENGEQTYFARTLVGEVTTKDLLETLSRHGIPLEITDYDLDSVPREMLLRVMSEDILTEPLQNPKEIMKYIDQEHKYEEEPEVYMDATIEWHMNEHGVMKRNLKPWHAFVLFIPLSLLSAIGFMSQESGLFLSVAIPYAIIAVSYIAYIYFLREPKYWKTIFHAGITFGIYIALLHLTGHDPFTTVEISSDPDTMATLKDKTAEAVIGTVVGFYGGSYILYIITEGGIRERWPAKFHEEVLNVKRRKRI